jgi:tRNA A37 threonylcarbamoyladenosine biosynthesis protein TsaE
LDFGKDCKQETKDLLAKFASDFICPPHGDRPSEDPSTILMAGSPGAGKTEFSLNLIKKIN